MAELYREFRYCRMFPTVRDYETDAARKTDWFIQFEAIDRAVEAERQAKAYGGGGRG